MTKDDLYTVNIEYTKEKYNHLKKEFVEATIYYYIEQYKQSVNQLINNNIEFANNIYYEFIITDKEFTIPFEYAGEVGSDVSLASSSQCIEYNEGLNEHIYALGSNTIIHAFNTLIVHIN